MLFRKKFLDGISAQVITRAYRCWTRPSVKAGGQLKTAIGVLSIDSVFVEDVDLITNDDARAAGFDSLHDLLEDIAHQRNATLYRVDFHLSGQDPRIALRECAALSVSDVSDIAQALRQLDRRSRVGPWTRRVLELVASNPEVRAVDLAMQSGLEKEWLKLNIRKLKNLGLTESLTTGYRISPRGQAYLNSC